MNENLPVHSIEPPSGWALPVLRELWDYREVLRCLVWRDLMVRYKQTALGIAWIVLQPLITVAIMTLIFGKLAKMPSEGLPYPVFVYSGLLGWNFFAFALDRASGSLVANQQFLTRVYFPRLAIPLSAVIAGLPDFAISFVVFVAMAVLYGVTPGLQILALPLFLALSVATVFALSLWLSSWNVYFRDVKYILPFVLQLGLYATPVVYAQSLVPERWRWLYALNPMAAVITGFRWCLVGGEPPPVGELGAAVLIVAVILGTGLFYFHKMEDSFADIV